MAPLIFQQRWVALPLRVFIAGFALLVGGLGVFGMIVEDGDALSFRTVVPAYAIQVYSAIALWFNRRTATITPSGVQVKVGPFPMCTARSAAKANILYCYVHSVRIYDDGTELENYDNVGVETSSGEQFTVSGPHLKPGEALQAASQVAQVLAPLEVRVLDWEPTLGRSLRILKNAAFWLALTLIAIFVGVAWDLELWL
jgi:hypothetical protein